MVDVDIVSARAVAVAVTVDTEAVVTQTVVAEAGDEVASPGDEDTLLTAGTALGIGDEEAVSDVPGDDNDEGNDVVAVAGVGEDDDVEETVDVTAGGGGGVVEEVVKVVAGGGGGVDVGATAEDEEDIEGAPAEDVEINVLFGNVKLGLSSLFSLLFPCFLFLLSSPCSPSSFPPSPLPPPPFPPPPFSSAFFPSPSLLRPSPSPKTTRGRRTTKPSSPLIRGISWKRLLRRSLRGGD